MTTDNEPEGAGCGGAILVLAMLVMIAFIYCCYLITN